MIVQRVTDTRGRTFRKGERLTAYGRTLVVREIRKLGSYVEIFFDGARVPPIVLHVSDCRTIE